MRTLAVPVDHIEAMKKAKAVIDQLLQPDMATSAQTIYAQAREAEVALRQALLAAPGVGWSKDQMLADISAAMDRVPTDFNQLEACGAAVCAVTKWARIREGLETPAPEER